MEEIKMENENTQVQHTEETNPIQETQANPNTGADQTQNPVSTGEAKTIPYDRFKAKVDEVNTFTTTLKELGFDNIDSLKEFATTAKDLQAKEEERKRGEMSEIEKLQNDLAKANETITSLNDNLRLMNETSKQQKIRGAFEKAAREKGIAYLEDAFELSKAKISSLEVAENGEVNGVEDIVKELIESKPFLLNQVEAKPHEIGEPSNPTANPVNNKSKQEVLKEYADRARRTNKHEDMVAYMRKKKELGL
jgi:hypothetical protein